MSAKKIRDRDRAMHTLSEMQVKLNGELRRTELLARDTVQPEPSSRIALARAILLAKAADIAVAVITIESE